MKRYLLYLAAAALMGAVACYLPVDIQCTSDADCTGGQSCSNNQCSCPASKPQVCDLGKSTLYCANIVSDKDNCGACGKTCGTNEYCDTAETNLSNKCKSCDESPGTKLCAGECIDVQNDTNNCGDCGKKCADGEPCIKGVCGCTGGEVLCGGTGVSACVDTNTSLKHCGKCNNPCPAGQICDQGTCAPCPNTAAQPKCSDTSCPILATDNDNCGKCGNKCGNGTECCNGTCLDPTKAYTTKENCGACGSKCDGDNACEEDSQSAGKFICVCSDKSKTSCNNQCVDLQTDPGFCGDCNTKCDAAKEDCSLGKCCPKGFVNCGGVCKDVQNDTDNCGTCGASCGNQVCASGKCVACDATNKCPDGLTCASGACTCGKGCGWVFSTARFSETANTSQIQGMGVATDKAGNVYVTGWLQGNVQFAEGVSPPKTFMNPDIFVLKLNPRGGFVWVKVFGGDGRDEGHGIAVSDDGKTILIAGVFAGKVDIAPKATPPLTLNATGGEDAFVLALDEKGEPLFAINGGGTENDEANGISFASPTTAFITGKSKDAATFGGSTLTSTVKNDTIPFVARVDIASKKFDKVIGVDSAGSVGNAVDANGNDVYVVGNCAAVVPWKAISDLCKAGSGMMFLRFDKDLEETSDAAATLGGAEGRAVVIDSKGIASATGSFNGTIKFAQAMTATGFDVYVTQLISGDFANTVQGSDPQNGSVDGDAFGIASTNDGGVSLRWITGVVSGLLGFGGKNLKSLGKGDIFVAQLDDQHKWTDALSAGSTEDDHGLAIAPMGGSVVVTGYFSGEVKNFSNSQGAVTIKNKAAKELFVWKLP